jgi:hypothetical protein
MDGMRYQRPISEGAHAGRAAWSSSASGVLRKVWDNMVSSSLTTEGGRAFISNSRSGVGQESNASLVDFEWALSRMLRTGTLNVRGMG